MVIIYPRFTERLYAGQVAILNNKIRQMNIDWEKLSEQKESLLEVIEWFEISSEPQERIDHLYGILHLIDALQDIQNDFTAS
jgi:uncharacterized protein YpuA (DUF1002 family)